MSSIIFFVALKKKLFLKCNFVSLNHLIFSVLFLMNIFFYLSDDVPIKDLSKSLIADRHCFKILFFTLALENWSLLSSANHKVLTVSWSRVDMCHSSRVDFRTFCCDPEWYCVYEISFAPTILFQNCVWILRAMKSCKFRLSARFHIRTSLFFH